jgi:hypothetical protein
VLNDHCHRVTTQLQLYIIIIIIIKIRSRIEPVTFRLVAECLDQLRHRTCVERCVLCVNRVVTFGTIVINVFQVISYVKTRSTQGKKSIPSCRTRNTHQCPKIILEFMSVDLLYLGPLPMFLILSFYALCTVINRHILVLLKTSVNKIN